MEFVGDSEEKGAPDFEPNISSVLLNNRTRMHAQSEVICHTRQYRRSTPLNPQPVAGEHKED